jgi:hypothetical protein
MFCLCMVLMLCPLNNLFHSCYIVQSAANANETFFFHFVLQYQRPFCMLLIFMCKEVPLPPSYRPLFK